MAKIKVGDKEYIIKDKYTVLDHLNTLLKPELREATSIQIRMVAAVSSDPKLSKKDVMMMDYGVFRKFYDEINKVYGIPSAFSFLGQE